MGNAIQNGSSSRESGFELLRLMSIAIIIIGHFGSQSLVATSDSSTNCMIVSFLGAGGRIAVNLFLLTGTWFMVDSKFKVERILRLYIQVALYSIPLTILMILMGKSGGFRNIFQGFLPFLGRPLWFATAYISLIALSPFLNFAFSLESRILGKFTMVMLIVFSAACTIPSFTAPEYPAELAWFVIVYIFMGWAKRGHFFNHLPNKTRSAFLGFILLGALSSAQLHPMSSWVASYWLAHLPSLPNFIISLLIFNFFRSLKIGSINIINRLSSSVFAVYIVHQVPAFREYEWNVLCCAGRLSSTSPLFFASGVLGMTMLLILSITVADHLYRIPVQHLIERSMTYRLVANKLQHFYSL